LGNGYSKNAFIIGVTGHRNLPEDKIPAINQSVKDYFSTMKYERKDFEITVLSSLAEGADMLCAKAALDIGFRFVVPLPMTALEYRKDFSGKTAAMFDCLLSMADEVITVTPEEAEPAHPSRGFYYRQAGIFLVNRCDVLLAVWDGMERDSPDGAGTWETVKLAKESGKEVLRIW